MKLFVKTLRGNHFEIQVNPLDTVGDVKKNIESVQGADAYPTSRQMLIYQGKALTDGTTLEENKVTENSFIVVMLLKSKSLAVNDSFAEAAMPTSKALATPKSSVVASSTSSSILTDASPPASTPKSMPSPKALAEGSAPKSMPSPKILAEGSAPKSLPAPKSRAKASTRKSQPAPKHPSEASTPMSLPAPKFPAEASTSSLKPVINSSLPETMPAKLSTPKSPVVAATSPLSIVASGSSCASRRTKILTPKSPAEESTSPSTSSTNPSSTASTLKLPTPTKSPSVLESDTVDQAASNLDAPSGFENTIQQILDMGGGIWDRGTVKSALCAASNNPERAIDYLYFGIPKQAEASHAQSIGATHPTNTSSVCQQPTKPASVPSSRPNADIFPPAFLHLGSDAVPTGALDFLRNSEQFQVMRDMVRANPQVLQPMLEEFGKQNPNLMRLIREHETDFLRLLNEPIEGEEGNILGQFYALMPKAIQVTPAEHAAIERLEAMGFERSTVLEAYFACNKNEDLTANYLLDHIHEY